MATEAERLERSLGNLKHRPQRPALAKQIPFDHLLRSLLEEPLHAIKPTASAKYSRTIKLHSEKVSITR